MSTMDKLMAGLKRMEQGGAASAPAVACLLINEGLPERAPAAKWAALWDTLEHVLGNTDFYVGFRHDMRASSERIVRDTHRALVDLLLKLTSSDGGDLVTLGEFKDVSIAGVVDHGTPGLVVVGELPSSLPANVVYGLGGTGQRIHRCPECSRYFVARRIAKFCSRSCLEKEKAKRYKAGPERSEYMALYMHLGNYKVRPNIQHMQQWLEAYRAKRQKQGKPVSTRSLAELLRQK